MRAKIKLLEKRPPSHALIMRLLGVYIAAGHKAMDLSWRGELMQLDCDAAGNWRGLGNLNQESAGKIARELNDIAAFITGHFQIVTIK